MNEEENKKVYQHLMAELDVIRNISYCFVEKADTSPEDAKKTSEKANYLMRNWFIDHTVKSDMKMKGFMDNAR